MPPSKTGIQDMPQQNSSIRIIFNILLANFTGDQPKLVPISLALSIQGFDKVSHRPGEVVRFYGAKPAGEDAWELLLPQKPPIEFIDKPPAIASSSSFIRDPLLIASIRSKGPSLSSSGTSAVPNPRAVTRKSHMPEFGARLAAEWTIALNENTPGYPLTTHLKNPRRCLGLVSQLSSYGNNRGCAMAKHYTGENENMLLDRSGLLFPVEGKCISETDEYSRSAQSGWQADYSLWGPSLSLALHAAEEAVNVAAARTIAASQAVLSHTGTIEEWRRAYWAELGPDFGDYLLLARPQKDAMTSAAGYLEHYNRYLPLRCPPTLDIASRTIRPIFTYYHSWLTNQVDKTTRSD
ncbi:uncharacterized protein CDV56_105879 [Aspergillus thermomutatus]|uniref:Uncharacterized protein n=1 Tax=Aspergillus thermomutatus TaxID=41047 RepID=A0A397GWE5_ASPTH|nr:uncharacterized protein CDV56_105879 [Aspergillus thermomutatus]RHZ54619.1 hypothetical protein CDV56_105879 [Aspergillus thermomutatus]